MFILRDDGPELTAPESEWLAWVDQLKAEPHYDVTQFMLKRAYKHLQLLAVLKASEVLAFQAWESQAVEQLAQGLTTGRWDDKNRMLVMGLVEGEPVQAGQCVLADIWRDSDGVLMCAESRAPANHVDGEVTQLLDIVPPQPVF